MILKLSLILCTSVLAHLVNANALTTDGSDIVIKTKGGFEAKTKDGNYSFKLGGRVQIDANSYDGVINSDAAGATGSDIYFRRGRLEIKGQAKDWKYSLSYNLPKGGSIDILKMTYIGFGSMANVSFGQQKEGLGLDDTGSSKWTTAIERALVVNAFDAGQNLGVKLHGANDLMSYSLGVYKDSIDSNKSIDSGVTGRVVVRPIYNDGALLHLGLGATRRSADGASDNGFDDFDSRLGARGGADGSATKYAPKFASGDGDKSQIINVEAAYSAGPLYVIAEYYTGEIDAPNSVVNSASLKADGYYLQSSYLLTGEGRAYKEGAAVFDKIKPKGIKGAWEVFARYEAMNAGTGNNINLVGGENASVITLGANWYMNANVKVALNYINAKTNAPINDLDSGDALVGRLQFIF